MKVMKEDIEFTCKITLFIVASLACLSVFVYSSISIDKSKLSEIRYCPSCGVDLIQYY